MLQPVQHQWILLKNLSSFADAVLELNDLDWHTISTDELCTRLRTSMVQGLSREQAAHCLQQYGRNMPSRPPSQMPRKIFGYFFGGFGAILLAASILVFVAWKPLGRKRLSRTGYQILM
jgi:sodium/potassium-transporting ATPase subunit alpha